MALLKIFSLCFCPLRVSSYLVWPFRSEQNIKYFCSLLAQEASPPWAWLLYRPRCTPFHSSVKPSFINIHTVLTGRTLRISFNISEFEPLCHIWARTTTESSSIKPQRTLILMKRCKVALLASRAANVSLRSSIDEAFSWIGHIFCGPSQLRFSLQPYVSARVDIPICIMKLFHPFWAVLGWTGRHVDLCRPTKIRSQGVRLRRWHDNTMIRTET